MNDNLKPMQTERQLLGTLLVSNGSKLVLVDDILNTECFSSEYHKNIFKWVQSRVAENKSADIEKLHSCWRKEGHIIGENYGGWTELYLIRGGKSLDVKETNLDVNTGAKKGEIKRAFAKMNKNKLKNRLLLSKFVDMVAA